MPGFTYETFAAIDVLPGCRHAFINRAPGVNVETDRAEALARLRTIHDGARTELGFGEQRFITAAQVHSNRVALVAAETEIGARPEVDGLITNRPDICLGIYVADCAAVYLVDPVKAAIGLVHSGKKGTELGIVPEAINGMQRAFGSLAEDIVVQIGPCIRPPDYEVDFAEEIVRQCKAAGLMQTHDCGSNTAAHLDRYYSYRVERGQTGRMLALLALRK